MATKPIHTFILLSEVNGLQGVIARFDHVLSVNNRHAELKEFRLLAPTIRSVEDARVRMKKYNVSIV